MWGQSELFFRWLGTTALSAMAVPALAQTPPVEAEPPVASTAAPEEEEAQAATLADQGEIVVTGSRIRGAATGSALIVVGAEDIYKQSRATTSEILRSVPQVVALGGNEITGAAAQRSATVNLAAGAGINLRGVGVEATLTLIDGRRTAAGTGTGRFFDPNSLPTNSLQRIEIVPEGASAIYGSDAITGVVNLIPYHTYDGIRASGRYGFADGLDEYRVNLIGGQRWASGGFVIAAEHYRRSSLATARRPDLYIDDFAAAFPDLSGLPDTRTVNTYPPNFGATPVRSQNRAFLDVGTVPGFLDASDNGTGSANLQSIWLGVDALPKQIRNAVYFNVENEIGSWAKLFAQGFWTKREAHRLEAALSAQRLTIPGTSAGAFQNIYNLTPAEAVLNYSFQNDLGNTTYDASESIWQGTIGANLDLGSDWSADIYGSTAYSKIEQVRSGINGRLLGAAASCYDPARSPFLPVSRTVATCNNSQTAFNPFSNGRPGTAAFGYPSEQVYRNVLESFTGFINQTPRQRRHFAGVGVNGSLLNLPGGNVGFAGGAEFQKHLMALRQISNLLGPALDVVNDNAVKPRRQISSFFGELSVPIFGDENAKPFLEKLSLSIAGRYDRYKDQLTEVTDPVAPMPGYEQSYDTFNPKVGVTWQPIADLRLRASYGTSFRAPLLSDRSVGPPTRAVPTTVTRAVSEALGIIGAPTNLSTLIIAGGNPDVAPETASSWSIGADFTPAWIRGFRMSLNYYNLTYKNQIGTISGWESDPVLARVLLDAGLLTPNPAVGPAPCATCFGPTINGYVSWGFAPLAENRYTNLVGTPYSAFARPGGIHLLTDNRAANFGQLETSGFDFQFSYAAETAIGSIIVENNATYVLNYDVSLYPGFPRVSALNTINFPLRFQTRSHLGWSNSGISADLFVNYQNSYRVPPFPDASAYTTLDLSVSVAPEQPGWLEGTRLTLTATNLLDSKPPRIPNVASSITYDPQLASPLGRMISLELTKEF
jgi:iron complex outermembrane receptor protein